MRKSNFSSFFINADLNSGRYGREARIAATILFASSAKRLPGPSSSGVFFVPNTKIVILLTE